MQYLELLSPAKNLECGKAAIDHGADAVYIGADRFGARAAAGNTVEDIARLCQYAHQFDAKVYVTVNTIVYDDEIQDTLQLCSQLQNAGADAILVQDMGLMDQLNTAADTTQKLALHASTQTDNRTAEKVRWLASLGFRRVVLARELSITEIAQIHRAVPEVELEVFVHGALCVSYSGQCYASEYCFKRSANRGECAQFCRMPMNLTDADGKTVERGRHLLSLKDMAQLHNLERLVEAGAVSFKIEGRLKDADYVKNVTAAYSQALDDICRRHPDKYRRTAMGHATYTFTPDVRKSFNRGFTTYFADGKKTDGGNRQQLASFDTPKALGEPVGRVKEIRGRSFNVASMEAFANGDGLCFFNAAGQLVGFRVNKAEGNRLFPLTMPKELRPGMQLYRNHDQAFETLLAKPSAERKMKVNISLYVNGKTIALTITDKHGNRRSASLACQVQTAQKPQDDNIRKQLAKLGGTPFVADSITIRSDVDSPFIPSSMLAALRRAALEAETTIGPRASTADINADNGAAAPLYPLPYLYNAANGFARDFYARHGVKDATAFDTGSQMLMQCRYCLRNELGYCTKTGRKAPWREPLTLSLDDGKEFALKFNCRKCEMEVWTK